MEVIRYQSTDGVLHETEEECAKRDLELRIIAEVSELDFDLGRCYSGADSGYDGRVLYEDDIPDFIADNATLIFEAFLRAMDPK